MLDNENELSDDNIWEMLDNMNHNKTNAGIIKKPLSKDKCENCSSFDLVNDQSKGCVKCLNCGSCSSQLFDENAEWSFYDDGRGEGSIRCGAATSYFLPKSSLGTTISGKSYSILKMLQNWNQMPYKERSLSEILQYIEQICRKNNLPKSVIDNVKILYKQIHDLKYDTEDKKNKNVIIRGQNRKGIYGAAVYYGAQLQGYSRTLKEIADMFEMNIKIITRGCRKFMELMKNNILINTISTSTPNDFIERFCYKLKLQNDQIDIISKISKNISKLHLASNHQPTSIATGSILIYAHMYNINIQKKTISEIFNISIVTIDKIFKKILPFKNVIICDKLTEFVKIKFTNAKYIMTDHQTVSEIENNTSIFRQNMIEMSEKSSICDSPTNSTVITKKRQYIKKNKKLNI